MMDYADTPYWARRCPGCTDVGRTNLECVTITATHLGITVDEAKRQFGPPRGANRWDLNTNWQSKADADAEY